MNKYFKHEEFRREVWVRAWTSVASAPDCKKSDVATIWADKCLKAFDERFKPPLNNKEA